LPCKRLIFFSGSINGLHRLISRTLSGSLSFAPSINSSFRVSELAMS
jgi:hypothetical protein